MARSRAPIGVVGGGTGGEQAAEHAGDSRRGLAARPDARRPGDALDHHGEPRVAQVEREAGEQVRGLDGGEVHADRADGESLVGAAHHVHGDGVGIGGERFAAEPGAPGGVVPPGGAVGAAGAVALGAGGVDRGAAREFFDLGGAGGAVGHDERAEQAGLQGERPGRGGRRSAAGGIGRRGRGGGSAPPPGRAGLRSPARLRRPRHRWSGQGRANRACRGRVDQLYSVRKGPLSDGIGGDLAPRQMRRNLLTTPLPGLPQSPAPGKLPTQNRPPGRQPAAAGPRRRRDRAGEGGQGDA